MARKKQLFKVRKNSYGAPLVSARSAIPPVVIDGYDHVYNEVHIYATLTCINITLRTHGKGMAPVPHVSLYIPYRDGTAYVNVEDDVKKLVKQFEAGEANRYKGWKNDYMGVLV